MKYIFDNLDAIKNVLMTQKVQLFLDYDGTLVPIADFPQKAIISNMAKGVLEKISKNPQILLTVISGRSLEDIQNMVGVKDIIYVGNHGFQIKGPGLQFEAMPSAAYKILLGHLKKEIDLKLADFPGAFIEDKGITISVHYRQVNLEQAIVIEHLLVRMTQEHVTRKEIRINLGKKVFEIRPFSDWDKGKAVRWILEREKGLPVYIGDDTTDEDAFSVIKGIGVTVFVGMPKEDSHAQYYLKDTDDVLKFLIDLSGIQGYEETIKS